ncbi:MAG: S8 family serine peptidase, partial [candidate division WOR-3 bacterium]
IVLSRPLHEVARRQYNLSGKKGELVMLAVIMILSANRELILGFEGRIPIAEIQATGASIVKLRDKPLPYAVIRLENGERVEDVLCGLPGLLFCEPRGLAWVNFTPNDPFYGNQWGLPAIKADSAWDLETGDTAIKVGFIDQGIQYTHTDINDHFGNLKGYDFVDDDPDPYPDDIPGEAHGTAIAGVSAAEINNGTLIAGTANIGVYALRCMNEYGAGTIDDIVDGIVWAADSGARVINMSLGTSTYYAILEAACQYAWDSGCVLVASSGSTPGSIYYPAKFPTVIAVGAVDQNLNLAPFSSYGPEQELVAPGVNIYTIVPDNTFAVYSGTSLSCAYVSGVAGLVASANPSLTNQQIRDILDSTAIDLGTAGWDQYYGNGLVNAYRAVLAAGTGTSEAAAGRVGLRVFPTVAKNILYLAANQEVLVCDATGRPVARYGPGKTKADLGGLEPGVYFVVSGTEMRRITLVR